MPLDNFSYQKESSLTASRAPYAVTPSDTVELPSIPKRLYIGGAGNVVLAGIEGAISPDVTYLAVPAGTYLYVAAQFVRATGTTATGIIAEA